MEDTEPYLNISIILSGIGANSIGVIVGFVAIALLFFISALVSGSEVAFFSLSPNEIDRINSSKGRITRQVNQLLDDPERLLATILITNNFVNVGIVVISSFLTAVLFHFDNQLLAFFIQVGVITTLILFFCEILPKVYANRFSVPFARLTAPGLQFFSKAFWPLSWVLINSTSLVNKRLIKRRRNISIDELSDALKLTESNLVEEKSILKGIVRFGNIDVREIMRSRVDVVAIDLRNNFKELLKIVNESGFSRIPVFEDNFDQIKGLLYIKDLLPHLSKGTSFRWQTLIRPAYYVPESKKINDLLKEFQLKRVHLAIVVDEYGGSSGIVTMEDILEEIVGEISDESDEEEIYFQKIDEDNYIFKGKTPLNDFYRLASIDDDVFDEVKGEADTLAGLLLELRGEIPAVNDKLSYRNFVFKVREVDQRRIIKIDVLINR